MKKYAEDKTQYQLRKIPTNLWKEFKLICHYELEKELGVVLLELVADFVEKSKLKSLK